ncbi:MAG: sugar nucleotide-binding protein [Enterobacterales bacterium]|nr:sugar nucleotide-binding protein [Enterobacterales bacterium]
MTQGNKKVLIFGAGGRVGLSLLESLIRENIDVIAVDFLPQKQLDARVSRITIDSKILDIKTIGNTTNYGNVNVLDQAILVDILNKEQPDVVVNYAIPFTWDAAKTLPNYNKISAAGLGAFSAVQVLAPKIIAEALAKSNSKASFVVGNLPDITIPIIHGLSTHIDMVKPVAGAGNVGLIEAAIKHRLAKELDIDISDLILYLVCHHVHLVVPREPGYANDGPFMLKVLHKGKDISHKLGDLRELMNRSISQGYEPGAGFSSTTGILASRVVVALLDDSNTEHRMHCPAPNGLDGGYPVIIQNGEIRLDIPEEWVQADLVRQMRQVHSRDGVEAIRKDGTIIFTQQCVNIMKEEIGITLPVVLTPDKLEEVAKEQIRVAQLAIS